MLTRLNINQLNKKHIKLIGILILLLALPLTLILVGTIQDQRSSAATPDQLEAEAGVLSSSGVTKQSDPGASGGQYIRFTKSLTNPTPTSPPSQTGYGPRPAPPTPTGSNVYYLEDAGIADNGTGQVGQQITDYINTLPDGSIVVFARRSDNTQGWVAGRDTPLRTYHLKRGIKVNRNLTLWGYGVRLEQDYNDNDHPVSAINPGYDRSTSRIINARILGFDYLGPHDSPESSFPSLGYQGQHFVGHRGITTTEIADNHMYAVQADGIMIPSSWDDQSATQLNANDPNHPFDYIGLGGNGPYHWHHNNILGVRRQGITFNQNYNGHPELRDVNVSTIEYNHIANMGMMGIDNEDSDAACNGWDTRMLEVRIQYNYFSGVNNLMGKYSSPWIGLGAEYGDCASNLVSADHPEYVGTNVHPHLVEFGPVYIQNNTFASYDNPVHFQYGGAYWEGWGTGMTYIAGGITPANTGPSPSGVPQGTYHDWYILNNTWDTSGIPINQVRNPSIQAIGTLKGIYNVTITGNKLNGISFDKAGSLAEGKKTISNNSL